ncbi:hypothetical protein GBA52_015417 [Prunus armeniaca]|nr:hypothetical protein GBA52_015417 [Prunus armeniaca]
MLAFRSILIPGPERWTPPALPGLWKPHRSRIPIPGRPVRYPSESQSGRRGGHLFQKVRRFISKNRNVRAVSPHVPNYLVPDWIAFLVWHLFVRCPLIEKEAKLSLRNAMGTAFFVRFQLCYIDALPCERKHHM